MSSVQFPDKIAHLKYDILPRSRMEIYLILSFCRFILFFLRYAPVISCKYYNSKADIFSIRFKFFNNRPAIVFLLVKDDGR